MLRGRQRLPRPALARLEQDVAEFAGLGDFSIFRCASIRPGWWSAWLALATAIRPEILLMDEWILAGDAEFLDRARQRLEAMVRSADILVLSTHDMQIVKAWCSRALWLDQGQVRLDGSPECVADAYLGRAEETAIAAMAK
jgi:lipopolysaccharide transport system ATP-binding protein